MNAQKSRKIIVASGMAVAIGIGAMTFALRPHPVPPIAQAVTPPAPIVQLPDGLPTAVAPAVQVPAALAQAVVAQVADVPVALARKDVAVTKPAGSRHAAKVDNSAVVTHDIVTRIAPATTISGSPAMVANSVEPVKSVTELTPPPADSSTPVLAPAPTIDHTMEPSAQLATKDSQITTEVKSEIAVDTLSKDVNIGVVTTNGVVALTGSLTSQDAIDHVKEVVANVRDVKSVDTSALILANL